MPYDPATMTLADARRMLARGGAQVSIGASGSDTYSYAQADDAIQQIGNDFVERVQGLTTVVGTISGTVPGTTRDLDTSSLLRFVPEKLKRVTLHDYNGVERNLQFIDIEAMRRFVACQGTSPGTSIPTRIAFDEASATVHMDFMTGSGGTMVQYYSFFYDQPFTQWTPGSDTAGTTVLNIPNRHFNPVFHHGAPAVLQLADAAAKYKSEGYMIYEKHVKTCIGKAGKNRGVMISDECSFL